MKRLVLSEGRRDVQLVEAFYDQTNPDMSVITFHGEDVSYDQLKHRESDAIRNFLERRNPYDVLAKSENGKPNLKTVFVKLINFLARQDAGLPTLVIDLDGKELRALLDELDTRVRDNYQGQSLGIRETRRIEHNSHQVAAVAELYSVETEITQGAFDVLAFRQNLETSAGIRKSDGAATQEEKLRSFVEDEQATIPMRTLLL